MPKAAYILTLFFFLCISCRNTVGDKEKTAYVKADTSHLKNTPHDIDSLLIADNKPLRSFYRDNGYKTVWTNAADRKALHTAIEGIEADGLIPADYNFTDLIAFENDRDITIEECVAYDILLSKTF